MTDAQNAYDTVLRDFREKLVEAQRKVEEIRATIAGLEANRPSQPEDIAAPQSKITDSLDKREMGRFEGKSVVDATRELLLEAGKPMKVAHIAEALVRGGIRMESADKANTVGSILNRRARQKGDIQRVGRGLWALAQSEMPIRQ